MANKNISDLVEKTIINDSDVLIVEDSTSTSKVSKANLLKGLASKEYVGEEIRKIELLKGDNGEKGDTGTRGSKIWTSNNITGTSAYGTVFANSGIDDALVYDYCLNRNTGDFYVCSKAGTSDIAEWKYNCNIKGGNGEKGEAGTNGIDGKNIELVKADSYIKWRYSGQDVGVGWTNLIALSELKGDSGADAIINKLDKVDDIVAESDISTVITAFNNLISNLKTKGLMDVE